MYEIYVQLHLQNKSLVIIPYIIPMYPILWVLPVPFIKVRMDCLPTVKQGFGNSKSIIINNQLNSIYNSVYDFMVLLGKTSFLAHPPVYTIFAQKMTNKTHTHNSYKSLISQLRLCFLQHFLEIRLHVWQVALSLTCCRESLKGLVTIANIWSKDTLQKYHWWDGNMSLFKPKICVCVCVCCVFGCLFVCLLACSVGCLCFCLFVCLFVCLSVCLFVNPIEAMRGISSYIYHPNQPNVGK